MRNAAIGFDWEQGKLLLSPEAPLSPKSEDEAIWDAARELLMFIATKPVKNASYEIRQARRIFDRLGYDYMKYQDIFHGKKK